MLILLSLVLAPSGVEARTRSICGVVSQDCGGDEEMACEVSPNCDAGNASYPFDTYDPISCGIGTEHIDRFCYDCCGDGEPAGAAGCNSGLTHSRAQDLFGGSIAPCQNLLPPDASATRIEYETWLGTFTYEFDPPSSVDLVNDRGVCSLASPVDFSGASREPWPDAVAQDPERGTVFVIHGRGSSCDSGFDAVLEESLYDRNQLVYCVEYDNSPANEVRILSVLQDRTGAGPGVCVGSPSGCSFDRDHPAARVTASPVTLEGVAEALARAIDSVPTEGEITLIPHSQGGFVARALLHRHYDDLRWHGKPISRLISLGHPYFGVLTDPSLAAGWACADSSSSFKNCHVLRWLWGWQNWLDGSGAAIDNLDFPQIRWSTIAGDGGLGLGSNALASVFPGACIQVFGGISNASVMGDGTVPILSSLGLDEHDFFALESLDFDDVLEAPGCDHDAGCLLAGAVSSLGDDLLPRAAARESQGTLSFGGSQQVAITDPEIVAAVTLTEALTIEAWVRPGNTLANQTLLSKAGEYRLEYSAGTFHVTLDGFIGGDFVAFGTGVPVDAWTHVAVTYDDGILRGYVNGDLVHEESGGSLFDSDPVRNELRIGGTEDGSATPMLGSLDEIMIWGRALSETEIRTSLGGFDGRLLETSALRVWWRFDELDGDALLDSSGSGRDASLASLPDAPWRWGPARVVTDGALYFDGIDDRAVVSDPTALAALEMSDALTIEAWVNPRGEYWGAIVSKEGEYQLSRLSDGTIGFTLASVSPGWSTRTTGIPLPERTWTHVALVFDGSQARIYVNGTLAHSEDAIGPIGDFPSHASEDELWFGGRQWNLRNANPVWFGGLIDEVRIWNRERSGAKLREDLFRVIDPASTSGLVGAWRFGARHTDLVLDAVAGHHAILGPNAVSAKPVRSRTTTVPEPDSGDALAAGIALLAGIIAMGKSRSRLALRRR